MSEPENRRVLVVDDNPAIHDDFRTIHRGGGSPVTRAGRR